MYNMKKLTARIICTIFDQMNVSKRLRVDNVHYEIVITSLMIDTDINAIEENIKRAFYREDSDQDLQSYYSVKDRAIIFW